MNNVWPKIKIIILSLAIIWLYWLSKENYLFFHSIVEFFSICIAFSVFVVTFNSIKYLQTSYLYVVGYAYLFIGILDFLHTMSYKGMAIFTDYDYYANQLWIGARYFESIIILITALLVGKSIKIKEGHFLLAYIGVTAFLLYSIFFSNIFPICFIEGQGQTTFKIISEYIIIGILIAASLVFYHKRHYFRRNVFNDLFLSTAFTIFSEVAFTLYTDNYGVTNAVGHMFKVVSFYLIYKAIVMTGVKEPFAIIFKELNETKEQLMYQNHELQGMAYYDGLTGVHNKRYLLDRIDEEIIRFERDNCPFVLMIIDIDDFKNINDTYGHTVGDDVLKTISRILIKEARASDVVSRYGGDEFIILLLETPKQQAIPIAEKMIKAIDQQAISQNIHVTVSIGLATYEKGSAKDLIDAADKGLYRAKENGKNQLAK